MWWCLQKAKYVLDGEQNISAITAHHARMTTVVRQRIDELVVAATSLQGHPWRGSPLGDPR